MAKGEQMFGYYVVQGMEKVGFFESLSEDNLWGHMQNLLTAFTNAKTS